MQKCRYLPTLCTVLTAFLDFDGIIKEVTGMIDDMPDEQMCQVYCSVSALQKRNNPGLVTYFNKI